MDVNYRIYANGEIYHEDEFEDLDNSQPYYDDFREVSIPEVLVDFIIDTGCIK